MSDNNNDILKIIFTTDTKRGLQVNVGNNIDPIIAGDFLFFLTSGMINSQLVQGMQNNAAINQMSNAKIIEIIINQWKSRMPEMPAVLAKDVL